MNKQPHLFKDDVDWSALVDESGPRVRQVLSEVCAVLTTYGREYCDDRGLLNLPPSQESRQIQQEQAWMAVGARLASESTGAITPDMTANLFQRDIVRRGTKNYEPDMSFLNWCFQRKMTGEVETRVEWDAYMEFVRMDQAGQVKMGYFADASATMQNYEYGAGIPIKRTWFETNTFGIRMESLAPKFRWAYFDKLMSTTIYTALQAAITTDVAMTQNVIRDLNTAFAELKRYEDSLHQFPFGNASFHIIAPPECSWWLNAVMAMSYTNLSREVLDERPAVTYTTKLPAGNTIYVVVDNYERNELGTRVPFGVYGTADDIDTFAQKITYRGAWGFQCVTASGRRLIVNPAHADFIIGGPFGYKAM